MSLCIRDYDAQLLIFCIFCETRLALALGGIMIWHYACFSLGERTEDPQDLLQEVQEAPATQSDPVQEGQRLSVRPG